MKNNKILYVLKSCSKPTIIVGVFLAMLSLFLFQSVAVSKTKKVNQKPNIVFMMADNLGYGDLGCYGGGETRGMPTPHIDKLASESLRFTQFFVEPGSTPSRAATMTGRYSTRSGLSSIVVRGTTNTLADKEITMAEIFKKIGYNTAYYGKWHLGTATKSQPQNQGFDEYFGILNSTDEAAFQNSMKQAHYTPINSEKAYIYYGKAKKGAAKILREYTLEERKKIDIEIADRSVKYIMKKANKENPFFLFVGWTRPHPPNNTTKEFEDKSRIGIYGDSVMELDYNTGRVLDALKKAGIEDNTIVVWMSDNGPAKTSVWPDGGTSGPFRGELGSAWEGSLRTAGMIKWPGKIKPGVTNGMFSTMDFMPTIAKFVGAKMPTDRPIDGIDQSKWLLGQQNNSNREHLLTFIGSDLIAVRWNQFRIYLQYIVPTGSGFIKTGGMLGARLQLNDYPKIYNIESDPREEYDTLISNSWVIGKYLPYVEDYYKSLKKYPNPKPANITKFQE